MYIDVGGGSTELTLFSQKKVVDSASFKIGTIRLLNDRVTQNRWDKMEDWVKSRTKGLDSVLALGSGGNINKLYKMAEIPGRQALKRKQLKSIREDISALSFEDRVVKLGMNLDRADVIIPACDIFLNITKWAKISDIYVPEFGLSDGITRLLYEEYKKGNR